MAELILLRSGTGPARIASRRTVVIAGLIKALAPRNVRYMGEEVPTFPTDRQDLIEVRDPTHVVVRITAGETSAQMAKVGCYLIEGLMPKETKDWK